MTTYNYKVKGKIMPGGNRIWWVGTYQNTNIESSTLSGIANCIGKTIPGVLYTHTNVVEGNVTVGEKVLNLKMENCGYHITGYGTDIKTGYPGKDFIKMSSAIKFDEFDGCVTFVYCNKKTSPKEEKKPDTETVNIPDDDSDPDEETPFDLFG
jgi:hypothetical protein